MPDNLFFLVKKDEVLAASLQNLTTIGGTSNEGILKIIVLSLALLLLGSIPARAVDTNSVTNSGTNTDTTMGEYGVVGSVTFTLDDDYLMMSRKYTALGSLASFSKGAGYIDANFTDYKTIVSIDSMGTVQAIKWNPGTQGPVHITTDPLDIYDNPTSPIIIPKAFRLRYLIGTTASMHFVEVGTGVPGF